MAGFSKLETEQFGMNRMIFFMIKIYEVRVYELPLCSQSAGCNYFKNRFHDKHAYYKWFLEQSLAEFLFHQEYYLQFLVELVLHYAHQFFWKYFENNSYKNFYIS